MAILISTLAIIAAFWAAFQLQLVTFIPTIGLWSIHKFEPKRWALRLIAIGAVIWLGLSTPLSGTTIAIMLIVLLLLAMSFFNDNTAGFRALNPQNMDHTKAKIYNTNTLIVGVELPGGINVCYPVDEMIIPRHLINDTVSNTPILVSFCAACRSSMVYDPIVDGKRLTFQVIAVMRRNMVIRDRKTGTLWQQGTGEAIYGELKGQQLALLPAQQMNFGDCLEVHPNTLMARAKPGAPRGRIPTKALSRMLKITNIVVTPGQTDIGDDLPLREKIYGLSLNGRDCAYPISELIKRPVLSDLFGTEIIEITFNPETREIRAISQASGEPYVMQNHWWLGWKEHHPETDIWRAD